MNEQEIIKKSNGEPFGKKGHAENALRLKKLTDSYKIVEYEGGGFVCVPKTSEEKLVAKSAKPKTKRVRIHRASGSPENKDLQISICVNNAKNRKKFFPGEEVELTQSEISVLRDSVEENALYIPPDSGIYAARDPLAIARNQYPGMTAKYDQVTGQIKMIKRTLNYIIEEVAQA